MANDDLVETLTGVGETIKAGVRGLKNLAAPPGPGTAAPPLGKDASGNPVRYNKDGSPPTPVIPTIETNTGEFSKKKF